MLRPQPLQELLGCRRPPSALPAEATQQGPGAGAGVPGAEQQRLRRKINSRERKRMQDLNLAMDALREAILPYSAAHCQGPPGRKLSKAATLLLARNYILLLGGSLQALRRLLAQGAGSGASALPPLGLPLLAPGPLLLAPLPPPDALRAAPGRYLQEPGLCPCALCEPPRLAPLALQAPFSK